MPPETKERKTPEHAHTPEAIRARLREGPDMSYLREWVYGAIDGVVTTFAIVAGVTGASLSPFIVVILGVANLLGDGFSMAASAYSSARTDEDTYEHLRAIEQRHIRNDPAGETEEVRQIFAGKGFEGADLERAVDIIAGDRKTWIDVMVQEEYGIGKQVKTPLKIGMHTFIAFVVCGAMPLLPFLLKLPDAFVWALLLSALTFFAIGSFKSRWAVKPWWRSGLETFFIGMTAAGIAFIIGYWLKGLGL